jgi:hypothetical protein
VLLRIFVILVLAVAIFGGSWFLAHELYIKPEERLREDKAQPPPTPPPDPSLAEFEKCVEISRKGARDKTRTAIEQFLREYPSSTKRGEAHDILGEVNAADFFAARPDESNTYVVKSGDSISRVASRTKVPVELLVHLNRIEARYLHPNQRLLAPACSFRLVIQQKARRLVLDNGDRFFRQYPAAAWPGGDRAPVILAKQAGRVTEKRAFDATGSIAPSQIRYFQAYHMILVNIPGRSLHTQPDDPQAVVQRPPGGGIGVAPKYMNEIAVLLPGGAPVSME